MEEILEGKKHMDISGMQRFERTYEKKIKEAKFTNWHS